MRSSSSGSSSRANSSEPSPMKKNKSQSQREYRSKEIDGFTELRDALFLVDPFDTPLGRDATRHQLLVTAAKKLRDLADENEKLVLQLSARPSIPEQPEPAMSIPPGMATQHDSATSIAPWSNQGYDMEHLLSVTASEAVPQLRCYENGTPGWPQSPAPFYGSGHQPSYDMALGSSWLIPQASDMRQYAGTF